MKWNKFIKTLFMAPLVALFLSSCGDSGSIGSTDNTESTEGTGTLSVNMTDASTDQYQAVYVTIKEVQVSMSEDDSESGWTSVGTPNKTYDLLQLVNGTRESLGIAVLDSGHYTQMRLILGDTPDSSINILSNAHTFAHYVIDLVGTEHELEVPSGSQTGIKIVQGFDINANSTTELVLDFDASASVVIAGNSGKYMLKPTIKVLDTSEASIINGAVTKFSDDSAIANATVSAQVFDETALDAKDRVTVQAATIADTDGLFSLFLSPGTYNLVFYQKDFQAAVTKPTVSAGDTTTENASLDAATTGTISGTVNISGGDSEAYVTLSFIQSVTIDGDSEEIELLSLNVADGGSYSATLPIGSITIVSSSSGKTTQARATTINAGLDTVFDVSL